MPFLAILGHKKPLNSLELRGLVSVGPPGLEPVPKAFGMIMSQGCSYLLDIECRFYFSFF